MAVLLPGKFVYLATPHTATIATTMALLQLEDAIPSDIHEIKKFHEGPWLAKASHHATLEELKEKTPQHFTGNEISVTTVRNPFDLIVTWWLRQRKQLGEKAGREPTFCEYLEMADEGTSGGPYIRDGRIFWLRTDKVFRYERLTRDLDRFLKKFRLPPVELPRTNVTSDKAPWISYYDSRAREIAVRKFGEEAKEYAYQF